MANENYTAPGVYVEEISTFPPSVAQVATAIPAFVGYTQIARGASGENLNQVPTKISSMLDYRKYFGGPPPVNVTSIELDDSNAVISATLNPLFYLYDSLQLFYANGGGDCYIVSIGLFASIVDGKLTPNNVCNGGTKPFTDGLDALKQEDEPTLLLFPDAVLLDTATTTNNMADVQTTALSQCADLKDRFTIMDLQNNLYDNSTDAAAGFRQNIGMNNLNYGAAYTPWLQTNFEKHIGYTDIEGNITRNGMPVTLTQLTNDSGVQTTIQNLSNATTDLNKEISDTTGFISGVNPDAKTLQQAYKTLTDTYESDKTSVSNFKALLQYTYSVAKLADSWANGALTGTNDALAYVQKLINNNGPLNQAVQQLVNYDQAATLSAENGGLGTSYGTQTIYQEGSTFSYGGWSITVPGDTTTELYGDGTVTQRMTNTEPDVNATAKTVNDIIANIIQTTIGYANTYENTLYQTDTVYANIVNTLKNYATQTPPSGAMAGVYAYVDNNMGVWKAPANVSLNSVIGPVEKITTTVQGGLNVDPTSGKSVNAIRSFTGEGTLVWGARTLAGNDNNWRYISVRRLFIMVEESIQKSISWAVFEPNTAVTWVKAKAEIENYLTNLWREGALAGAKTTDAFFVNIGLGSTMTSDDILNGKMIVVVGMAPVRPAEFIILKFTQMLQTS